MDRDRAYRSLGPVATLLSMVLPAHGSVPAAGPVLAVSERMRAARSDSACRSPYASACPILLPNR